ncbi:hypothetical protein [Bacillus cereus]|uniref:hypothetical protein n=1 Tax=Bacillus cereus TaxID=1396 RepID=UPI0018F714B7|nr:hypothetical protein [Bacillus cereus]MBJ8095570.1 hypothetical protein [Bacillus cereus]
MKTENLKLRFWLGIAGFIILGLILLIISQFISNNFFKNLVDDVASALLIAGTVGFISEVTLKDKMVSLILEKLQLKEQIDKTGVVSFTKDIGDIDFRFYFKAAKKQIDIVHIYGRTWTHTNLTQIKDKLRNSNCKIRVILLHPESDFISGLTSTYNCSEEEIRKRITDVENIWREIYQEKQRVKRRKTQSTLDLYYTKFLPMHSLYRFDGNVIQIQAKTTPGRSGDLTTIICKENSKADNLYNKYIHEIDELIEFSELLNLEETRQVTQA